MVRGRGWSGCIRVMSGYVERGELPGLVLLLSRYGAVHTEVLGSISRETREPMRRDDIISHRLALQAHHGRGGDDPGRGVQAAAR